VAADAGEHVEVALLPVFEHADRSSNSLLERSFGKIAEVIEHATVPRYGNGVDHLPTFALGNLPQTVILFRERLFLVCRLRARTDGNPQNSTRLFHGFNSKRVTFVYLILEHIFH